MGPEEIENKKNYIVQKAKEYYNYINTATLPDKSPKFRYPNPGEEVFTRSDMWELKIIPVEEYNSVSPIKNVSITKFYIKDNVEPQAPLTDFLVNGGVVDCFIIADLVNQLISLDLIDKKYFNHINGKLGKGASSSYDGIRSLTLPSGGVIGMEKVCGQNKPLKPGEFGYFSNIDLYHKFHPHGVANGQNVFCVGKNTSGQPLYVGFGEFFITPRTEIEIMDELYHDAIMPIINTSYSEDVNCFLKEMHDSYSKSRDCWNTKQDKAQENQHVYSFIN
jgi:hypothetical protein